MRLGELLEFLEKLPKIYRDTKDVVVTCVDDSFEIQQLLVANEIEIVIYLDFKAEVDAAMKDNEE